MATSAEEVDHLRRLGLSSAMVVPLRARGRTLGAIAWISTARERRYGPHELALAEEIAHRAALAVDNAILYREAQAAIQVREDMVAVATHDLRIPIQNLKLDVQTQLRRLGQHGSAPDGAELADALRRIDRQVGRLAQLVTYFLEISKAAAGELEVHLEPVDATALVREVVARARSQREASGSPIVVYADHPEVGLWDGIRLDQVVSNLLSNALKFGRGKPVEVSVEGHDHTTLIRVCDHGIGIPESDQALIFERFRRGGETEPFSGAGLGLYIVQRVVKALGGKVSVDSKPGEGSTFTIELPRRDPPS